MKLQLKFYVFLTFRNSKSWDILFLISRSEIKRFFSSFTEMRSDNSPNCVLGLKTEEETLREGFNIINTILMFRAVVGCQVS